MTNDASQSSPLPRAALAAALDLLIPPSADGRLPGAGELGLARYVEELLATMPAPRPLVVQVPSARQHESGSMTRTQVTFGASS